MPAMTDDAVRELHGVRCRRETGVECLISIREADDAIVIGPYTEARKLTEWQARYLAAKLYRLARRVKARREALETTAAG